MSTLRGNKLFELLALRGDGSSESSGRVGRPRNMKSMWPLLAAIFSWLIFTGLGGGAWPPCPPPLDPLLGGDVKHFAHTM